MCFCTAAQYEEEAQVIHSVRRVYNACFNSDMHIQYDRACIPDQAECGLRTDPASYQVVRPSERKHVHACMHTRCQKMISRFVFFFI